jgi:uncharacterized membrane protein YhhN
MQFMKKQGLIILFFLLLIADITGIVLNILLLQYITKPLLMPVLAVYFLAQTVRSSHRLEPWILGGLFFSWAGDVLLMFQDKIPDFFLFGLAAFLVAHIFYIVFFHRVRVLEGIRGRFFLLLPVVLYYAGLIIWLSPYLGDMSLPVRIYGIVISFMLMMALHMLYSRNKKAGSLLVTGAILFVISDSVLAINKFYQPFDQAGIVIMLTYGLAQLLIVKGAVEYSRTGISK